ncbi:MAG: PEP/pyruvate-binding domain-containing protein [Actinomycetota bacterium]
MWWPTWRPGWRRSIARAPIAPGSALALGSGTLAPVGIGPKAALLDRATMAGLPVPVGFTIPDGEPTPDVASLVAWAARIGVGRVAVRSAFGAEDAAEASLAGWFDSLLDVAPADVPEAVDRVRASAERHDAGDGPARFRRDVLVMSMVEARLSGVAFSEPGTYDDLINVTPGTAERLVAGLVPGQRFELDRLGRVDGGWQRRLQRLLAALRREFGDEPLDVEWADDGSTCWLLQVRPITAPLLRNETLTAANHAEILPALPSHLMTSVIAEAGPDLFEWYRRRVPGLPADRDFLHVKAGRPMINLSLLEDMLRHLGLPTALVAGSIGGGSGRSEPAAPGRLVSQSPSLLRLGVAQIVAVVRSGANRRRVAAIGSRPAETFTGMVDDLHRAYVALVTGMFPLSSAIGPPLGVLRAAGTLYEHAGRHRTITTELADRLGTIDGPASLDTFLAEFGHRGVYESDIARPRYADDPGVLGGGGPTAVARSVPDRTLIGALTWPLWLLAARPLAAREWFRHDAMRAFAAVRRAAVALAERAVVDGRLRSVDDLWLLTADEVRSLDDGWRPDLAFWTEREQLRSELASLDVPHVIGLHDPLPLAGGGHRACGMRGLPLTAGTVTGVARVLDEPAACPTLGTDGLDDGAAGPVVLVARSIDAGWVTTLAHSSAVVVEIGGDLSHGSILVRELGLPAVTNVAGATGAINDGDTVRVDGGAGTVDVVARVTTSDLQAD